MLPLKNTEIQVFLIVVHINTQYSDVGARLPHNDLCCWLRAQQVSVTNQNEKRSSAMPFNHNTLRFEIIVR